MSRVTLNFSMLSKIYNEMMGIIYDTDPESMMDEYVLMSELGQKIGSFIRIATGYTEF